MNVFTIWHQKTIKMSIERQKYGTKLVVLLIYPYLGDACKKCWRGLRDTYKRYKRAAQLASGSGAPTPSNMRSLEFLNNYKDARSTIGSVIDNQGDKDRVSDCVFGTVSEPTTNTDNSTADPIEIRTRKYTKKQANEEVTSVFKDIMKECADTVKELASANEKDRDSTSVLFKSLAKKFMRQN